jgi:hypothetical protein
VGEEGFKPPTPWFVATCSNPLSYKPHLHWIHSQESLPKEGFLSSAGVRKCGSKFIAQVLHFKVKCGVGKKRCQKWGFEEDDLVF